MKKISIIFTSALVLNVIWENLHSFLYHDYMGGVITEYILLRAAIFDAVVITIIILPFVYFSSLRDKGWLIIVVGIVIAVLNECYGLGTGRWTYNELMPIIPIIKIGLTPTIQLGITGYVAYRLQKRSLCCQ